MNSGSIFRNLGIRDCDIFESNFLFENSFKLRVELFRRISLVEDYCILFDRTVHPVLVCEILSHLATEGENRQDCLFIATHFPFKGRQWNNVIDC